MDGAITASVTMLLAGDFGRGYAIRDALGSVLEYVPHMFGSTARRPTGEAFS